MKIGVTGFRGNLGAALIGVGCSPLDCDITDPDSISNAIDDFKPDVIINCAAITDVDKCENKLKTTAMAVNLRGAAYLRWMFNKRLIHISTSYVFDGKHGPYTEKDRCSNPVNEYGWTKLGGELMLNAEKSDTVIVRTMGFYGGHKPDLVTYVVDNLESEMEIEITNKVIINPTYIPHLVEAILKLADMESPPKIINLVGEDRLNRYEFSLMVADVFHLNKALIMPCGIVSRWIAPRPQNASLSVKLAKRLGLPIHSAREGLEAFHKKIMEKI